MRILIGILAGLTAIVACIALHYLIIGMEKLFDYFHKRGGGVE